MASFAISYHFGRLLAAEGLEVTGLENPPDLRSARLHLPCGGRTAKRIFSRLFHACYIYTREVCDCCPGYYTTAKEQHARENIRCVLGVIEREPDTVREPLCY